MFVMFWLVEWKAVTVPIMPLHIFRTRSNLCVFAVCFCHALVFIACLYFLPLYFQIALGATPLQSGTWTLALAVPFGIVSVLNGFFIKKRGRYIEVIIIGMAVLTLGTGLLINLQSYRSWTRIIIFQVIAALGMSPVFQAPIIALQTRLQPKDIASGMAAFQFTRQLGSAVSIVIGQVLFQSQIQQKGTQLADAGIPPQDVSAIRKGSFFASIRIVGELPAMQRAVVSQATTDSLSKIWIMYTIISFVGLLAAFGIGRFELTKTHTEFKTGLKTQKQGETHGEVVDGDNKV